MQTYIETETIIKRTKVHVEHNGKKWKLPGRLPFGDSIKPMSHYKVIDYRPARKDEYYVSGAIPEIYKARNDLIGSSCLIIELEAV